MTTSFRVGGSFRSGIGAPPGDLGFDGDFYVDATSSSQYYGPKRSGTWGQPKAFVVPQSNYTSSASPALTDDQSKGYSVGSFWVNVNTNIQYVCTDAVVGAAEWVPILPVGNSPGTVAAGDDSRIVNAIQSGTAASGDLSGTLPSPTVVSTHLAAPMPVAQGGTGSASQNFVDLTNDQSIAGTKTFTGTVSVPTPTAANSPATKTYADGIASGLSVKGSSVVATTAALPSNTYANGTLGVGATLTATATGTLTVDGHLVALNDRIVVKNEAAAVNNGIYLCTTAGASGVAYVLTRATDTDQATEIPGAYSFVSSGTTNAASGWIVAAAGPYVIGTTAINWTQFSSAGTINAGTGLSQAGNTISLTTPVAPANMTSATTSTQGVVELAGDLGGTATSPSVLKINGIGVSGTPVTGQVLAANSGSAASWQVTPGLMAGTGVLSGGSFTVNGSNPSAFDLVATTGYVCDYTTNPASPTVTKVNIPAQTVAISGADTSREINWWVSDVNGVITSVGSNKPTDIQRRSMIQIGVTASTVGTGAIFAAVPAPSQLTQPHNQFLDFLYALGPFVVDGNIIGPNGANLSFNKTSGRAFFANFQSATVPNDPHNLIAPAETPVNHRRSTQISGSASSTLYTTIDPANYDVGGVITPVTGGVNASTIQRVWLFGTGSPNTQVTVQYGQNVYTSISAATSALGSTNYIINPDFSGLGIILGWLIVTRTATNLSDPTQASFILASKFAKP